MSKQLKHILITLIILWFWYPLSAQEEIHEITIDSSTIKVEHFNDDLSKRYIGDEFVYDKAEGEAENFLKRGLNWFFKGLESIFGIEINPNIAKILENIIYVILIGIAVYLLIRLLAGKDAVSLFRKKNTVVAPINISEEHIENIDLDELIRNALAQKDFRQTIRYMYLKALQELTVKNIIEYHFEKTNTDYYQEIVDTSIKQYYNQISYLYDNIWYGEFDLDENGYQKAKIPFDQLQDKLNTIG